MLKKIIFCFGLILCLYPARSQEYFLPQPKEWDPETFNFPIEFAPNIPYSGTEELRFAPGWGDTKSENHWSYCFVWWIKGDSKIDAPSLKQYLEEYYNGLVNRNIISRKIEASKVVPTVASVRQDSKSAYACTVDMLDYMSENPVKLNVNVNIQDCNGAGKRAMFFSISPQPKSHKIWKEFEEIWKGFKCSR